MNQTNNITTSKYQIGRCITCGVATRNYRCANCKSKFLKKNGYQSFRSKYRHDDERCVVLRNTWGELSGDDVYQIAHSDFRNKLRGY